MKTHRNEKNKSVLMPNKLHFEKSSSRVIPGLINPKEKSFDMTYAKKIMEKQPKKVDLINRAFLEG